LLIDADTLSDVFKEPFYTDARQYNVGPGDFYKIRMKNTFYTQTAGDIFRRELKKRAREIGIPHESRDTNLPSAQQTIK
jgi:hypothetical protein